MAMGKLEMFDIHHQWKLFLERSELPDESKLPDLQRREMKRAFVAGMGQMLLLMRDDIAVLPEYKGVQILEGMLTDMKKFWNNQVNAS